MLTTIPELDRRGLRSFGFTTGLMIAALFGLAAPWLLDHDVLPVWPWAVACALAGLAAIAPLLLRPVYRTWMTFGLLMSRVTTPLVLATLFFFVVTPIARVRALFGNDRLARRLSADAASYRTPSKPATARDLERPF